MKTAKTSSAESNWKQDGRLAPAYISQEYKYFDQNESFLQTSIPPLISIFYALFVQIFLSHSTEKFRWGTHWCIRKFRVAKNFMHQRGGGGIKIFRLTVPKISVGGIL